MTSQSESRHLTLNPVNTLKTFTFSLFHETVKTISTLILVLYDYYDYTTATMSKLKLSSFRSSLFFAVYSDAFSGLHC